MGSLGFWEIVGLAVIALFVFGPERLPGMARSAGRTISAIRREANKTLGDLKDAVGMDDDIAEVARDARELRTSLKDVRRTAATAFMGPVDEVRGELRGARSAIEASAQASGAQASGAQASGARAAGDTSEKAHSAPAMADLRSSSSAANAGDAPFDPDAT